MTVTTKAQMWLAALLVAVLGLTAGAVTETQPAQGDANPYSVIVDKNIFHLSDPPPPTNTVDKPKELPKVFLTGIFKIGEDIHVLFSIPAKDAKHPVSYFKLAPGEKTADQADNELELVTIHPDQQGVDVVVNGTAMSLTMASNSMASTGGKPPGGPPGPAAPAPATASTGGSSVIVGGGSTHLDSGSRAGNVYGGGQGNAGTGVYGGSATGIQPNGNAPALPGNGGQLLTSGGQGLPSAQVVNPTPSSPEAIAANILATHVAGGPPAPPPLQALLDGGGGSGPPAPPR